MSQPAKKRPAPPSAAAVDEARDEEGSGRFMIAQERSSSTMLPPKSPVAEAAQALDTLPLVEFEPDAIDASVEPQRGIVSGVFSQRAGAADEARDDELENAVASMHAYYRASERQQHERAQLVIEDFSLLPDNPYRASSLVPPARKPLALVKVLGWVAVVAALGTGAWFVQRETSSAHHGATPSASIAVAAAGAAMRQAVIAEPEPPSSYMAQPAAVVAVAAASATSAAVREDKPASEVLIASARKAAVSAPAEVARPVAVAPSRKEAATHDATAEAALRAVLAGSASDSASASGAKAEATAIPSEAPLDSTSGSGTAAALRGGASSESTPAAMPAPAEELGALPDLPAREDVVAGFERVREELSKCAGDKHGTVQVDAVIANSGRVSRALIDGVFKGTAEGSCMARAARAARFPQFSQPSLSVSYPIAL